MAVAILFLSCACVCVHASRAGGSLFSGPQHELGDSLAVYFRHNVSAFDPDYRENGARCDAFIARLEKMRTDDSVMVTRVQVYSSASPEGRESYNAGLAKDRAESVLAYLHQLLTFEDSIVSIEPITEDWMTLASIVESDLSVPSRQQAIEIIADSSDPGRKARLMSLNDGKTWDYLYEKHFPQLCAFRVYIYIGIPQVEPEQEADPQVVQQPTDSTAIVPHEAVPEAVPAEPETPAAAAQDVQICVPSWNRQITLKTNLIGWAMLGANISVEADIIPHLSIALPFHYSGGFDYIRETIKFRGIVFQPELRYYPWLGKSKKNDGFYIGAHFGLGWYNFALDGEWRYQDHNGETPSYGGGLSIGYAAQFRKHPRWGMEFGVGGGAYKSKYDVFFNESNGPCYEKGIETLWYGVDNVTLSFTYKFDLKRKGGKK